MSGASHSGRILIQEINIDFAVTPISNSAWTQVLASMPDHTVRIDITNTASDCIQIATGPAGSEQIVCQVGPEVPFQGSECFVNKTQRISLESTFDATLSSGRICLAFYR